MVGDAGCVLETEPTAGTFLRLEMSWSRDRFSQLISAVADQYSEPLLQSIDEDEHENWPPSPPLQQLLVEDRPTGPVALLVGMAGDSHWSASIQRRADPAGFRFDLACRIRSQPPRLGSTYRLTGRPHTQPGGEILLASTRCRVRIAPVAIGEEAVPRIEFGAPDTLYLKAGPAGPPPATARWMYEIVIL